LQRTGVSDAFASPPKQDLRAELHFGRENATVVQLRTACQRD